MSKSVLYMSMSLDGFITGPGDGAGHGLGVGGERLHDWLGEPGSASPATFDPPGASGQVFDELMATGAVVVGRKTFDIAGHWGGDHHGVPIFVPTRGTPPQPDSDWVHYVTDGAETAMRAGQGGRRRRGRDGPRRRPRAVVLRARRARRAGDPPRSRSCWARGGGCSSTAPTTSSSS